MTFRKVFNHIKIGAKFNLLLFIVFLIGISLSGAALSSVLQQRAQSEVTAQALLLMETVNAVRDYTQAHVNPLLKPKLETEAIFLPEAIPTAAVRRIIENLHRNENYKNFLYKDAAPNPTNLRDKADKFEENLLDQFRQQPTLKELSGFRTFSEGEVFYIARPFKITDQKCLQCHSTPAAAPKSLIDAYGPDHGFNWKLNDVIATQVVSVPAEDVFAQAHHSFAWIVSVLMGGFAIMILLINFLLKGTVIQRIKRISRVAQAVSMGDMDAQFEEHARDEIGVLADAFKRMQSSLEIAMQMLKQQNHSSGGR
jgi:HAMP domain-containing protein